MVPAQATNCPKLLIFLYRIVSNRQTQTQREEGGREVMIQQSLGITSHTNGKIGIIFRLIYRSNWEIFFNFKCRTSYYFFKRIFLTFFFHFAGMLKDSDETEFLFLVSEAA